MLALIAMALTSAAACSSTSSSAPHEDAEHAHPPHWGYGAQDGPAVWAELSPEYGLCGTGREQSPIDLVNAKSGEGPKRRAGFQAASLEISRQEHVANVLDNGHTIQVDYDEGSELQIGEKTYSLLQYHFHAPSEHTVDGRHFPMEMHLVHRSSEGELAVGGVLIQEGAHNSAFEPFWANLPDEPGEEVHLQHVEIDIDDLLPVNRRAYRYRGSLTTPPCSEGVSWIVAATPIELSHQQISAFTSIFEGNNRPVQSLYEREILIDSLPDQE